MVVPASETAGVLLDDKERVMVSIRPAARTNDHAHVSDKERGYAAYLADRPAPVDRVERLLLRLDWFMRRLIGQR